MLPDFVDSDDDEVQEIFAEFRKSIPFFAKRLTKMIRANLAHIHVMDEDD